MVGVGAGDRERRDEEEMVPDGRMERGGRKKTGEQRARVLVRRREQGEAFVSWRKKEWRSAAWESGEARRIGI